jgi:TrpR-related protein YerC/YecD
MNATLANQLEKSLAQVLADLKNQNESYEFLKDFLTTSERENFAKRLMVAYYLKKGRSYANIKNNLKVSSATIADIATMMKSRGFELALKKLEAEEWATKWSEKIKSFVRK